MSAKWTISLAEPHCSACTNKDGCTVFPSNDDGEFANVCADWKQHRASDDAALVEGISRAICAERIRNFGTAAGECPREVEIDYARAVIAYLEGRINV